MNKMEFIDLGLSSGIKWSKCNVGAETEIDYGYYFQCDDITDKSNTDYNWENYKYYGGPYNIMKCTNFKYSKNPDNKLILCPEDDITQTGVTIEECLQLLIFKNNKML